MTGTSLMGFDVDFLPSDTDREKSRAEVRPMRRAEARSELGIKPKSPDYQSINHC